MHPEARQEKLLAQKVGDELLVYDQERHRAHRLNPTAAWVWRHCDGQTGVAEMTAMLPSELGLPADGEVVWLALEQLNKAHLLQKSLQHRTDAPKLSRREVVRRLGLTGAFAVLLPVVTSIVAPTPAQARNEPGPGILRCCAFFCPEGTIKVCGAGIPCNTPEFCLKTLDIVVTDCSEC